MLNSEKYNFADFTRENMRNIIKHAKRTHRFITYDEIEETENENTILWRHDIDFSVHSAYHLAKIEKEEGVKATFFIWLQSKFYNTFERDIYDKLKEIVAMGHSVGVHLDSEFHTLNTKAQIEKALGLEKNILENLFDTKINVFSFHNPSADTLKNTGHMYAGLINTYSDYFKNVFYCSDSNGHWRHHRLNEVIKDQNHKKLQILLHPEWWTDSPMSPKQKIERVIRERAGNNIKWYEDTLKLHGRENIDW